MKLIAKSRVYEWKHMLRQAPCHPQALVRCTRLIRSKETVPGRLREPGDLDIPLTCSTDMKY